MTPRSLTIALTVLFAGGAVAVLAFSLAQRESIGITRVIGGILFLGLLFGLVKELIRGDSAGRWIAILLAGAFPVGVYVNSDGSPAPLLLVLAVTFSICAVGFLTPFVGRYFAEKEILELDDDIN